MDQNTPTNGTGSDKRNWRERLGIGAREMPKISDEFKAAQPPPLERAPGKSPQPVTKPAPMAPRVASAKPEASDAKPRQEPQNSEQASSPLAEKLKAQRAAAEKLAVQRVSAARERAEAKQSPEAVAPPAPTPKLVESASGKPKFTFAEEEFVNVKKEAAPPPIQPLIQPILRQGGSAAPPLMPPRPALGGERTQVPLLRPAAAQPQFRADPPPVYRPVEPATGYTGARARPFNLETGATAYGSRVAARRGAYDPYRRGPDAAGYEPAIHPDEARDPRATRPLSARGRPAMPPPEEDYDDEFEDELPRPRHRASASEYNSAYRDVEESYREDNRRSSGPWLLLLALLLAAAAAGGGIWLYQTKFKTVAGPAQTDTVPVVAAPEGAAKTAAEVPSDAQPEVSTASKKKIYDRIVGDQEVTEEQMAPVEGAPLQPEPLQAGEDNPPLTDSGVLTDESNPLPLPPPPSDSGDTQGNASQSATQQSAEAKPEDVQRVIAQPVASATDDAAALMPATGEPEPLPPPEPSMEQMAAKAAEPVVTAEPVPLKPAETDAALTAPAAEDQAAATEAPAPAPPVKKKAAAAAKKKKPAATEDTAEASAEPVVLVPPSQSAEILPPSQDGSSGQVTSEQVVEAPAKKKKKTLMDLINGGEETTSETPAAAVTAADQGQGQEVASLPEPTPEATQAATSGGSGYVVQLASFRSEAEAQAEYSRLASQHSGIVGNLPSRVSQAKVSGSTRYRLGLGPLASREEASKVCSSLVAAGERDCLVRRQ